MKEIIPYTTVDEALIDLDNGGRFYNIFTKAEDGTISPAELGKVAGIFNEKQKMILFLELSLSKLDANSKEEVISKLDEVLLAAYQKYVPRQIANFANSDALTISSGIKVTGIPELKESKEYFSGMILVPVGKVFVPIPISDMYHVYEIKDEQSAEKIIIAHGKGSTKLPENRITIAGVLKALEQKKETKIEADRFLEINYYLSMG